MLHIPQPLCLLLPLLILLLESVAMVLTHI
jgi:hypothetical protein